MNYRRGDIVLALFTYNDLRTQEKRPALIIQADNLNTGIDQVIVAQITSKVNKRSGHPSRIVVRLGSPLAKGTGLRTDSVIMTDRIATTSLIFIDKAIGQFPDMSLVDAALKHTLGLE